MNRQIRRKVLREAAIQIRKLVDVIHSAPPDHDNHIRFWIVFGQVSG